MRYNRIQRIKNIQRISSTNPKIPKYNSGIKSIGDTTYRVKNVNITSKAKFDSNLAKS